MDGLSHTRWSRRHALAVVSALTLTDVTSSTSLFRDTPEVSAMNPDALSLVVLTHGGWHGGWCWQRVSPLLREAGHLVLIPTLTGQADRAHVLTTETGLDTHIAVITNLLEYDDLTDVILVGHSYAGMVITGVAAAVPERIRRLVYLDAFVPQTGDALLNLLLPERAAFYMQAAKDHGDGWRVPPLM